ncbi:LysR family transcriptional regulator [Maliponia aquimaris]|uniref:HTH-type transcriptional regulator GltC n=1 Tax=Maliponia aquimaris TaxID=1673631 RepID=A0A238JR23_9RHOB|nr:LysR family transcriptional regulator [Maliponia aquimaris]SMX32654.1 HTH-type transcriptional regulator GltC [Maliponia aquimaris]
MMDIKQMEVFEAIMRSGTVSAAARELGMTQSAVSRILARFETEIGYELFQRTNGRLASTSRAEAVLVHVREVLASVAGLRDMRADAVTRREDLLRFVTVPSLAHALLPSVLSAYLERRPGTRYAFDVRTTENAVEATVRRQADFAIVALPVSHPTLTVTPLYRSTSCCILRRDHPLATRDRITARDLRDERLIFLHRRQPTRKLIEEAFARAGVLPNIAIETANVITACRCTARGLGISVVNGLMASYASDEDLVILPFEPRIHHTLAFVEPTGRDRPDHIWEFLDCLAEDIRDTAARRGVVAVDLRQGHSDPE